MGLGTFGNYLSEIRVKVREIQVVMNTQKSRRNGPSRDLF